MTGDGKLDSFAGENGVVVVMESSSFWRGKREDKMSRVKRGREDRVRRGCMVREWRFEGYSAVMHSEVEGD